MEYRISAFSDIWKDGIINIPVLLIDKYIKIAGEYQLKALLLILENNGIANSESLSKSLGQTPQDIDELLEFWIAEGILNTDDKTSQAVVRIPLITQKEEAKKSDNKSSVKKEKLSPPDYSPKEIVDLCRDNSQLQFLFDEAQVIFGRTISKAEQCLLINMLIFYDLKPEITLMILEYCQGERQKGRTISTKYIYSMAENWSQENINTVAKAEEKIKSVEQDKRKWKEVVALSGISHRQPTVNQQKMVNGWFDDFNSTMIALACDIMKESIAQPSLKYVNSILKDWKKKGYTSVLEVNAEREQKAAAKSSKNANKLEGEPTYNLSQIKENAINNTDI